MAKLIKLETKTNSGPVNTEIVAVFQASATDKKPIPEGFYADLVRRMKDGSGFNAKSNSTQFVKFGGNKPAESVLFVGMGPTEELTEEKARQAGGTAWAKVISEKVETLAVSADSFLKGSSLKTLRAFAEGLMLASYRFDDHKTKSADSFNGPAKVLFVTKDRELAKQLETQLSLVESTGEAIAVARDWSNQPSNIGTPAFFATQAQKLARQYGLKCKILTERDAAREKMGLFLSVGRGSEREGRIVILEYTPKGVRDPKTVALVGKGITFDSGGISLKPSARMEDMKHDMAGAATVMGAILLAASWKVRNRVVATLAFTENMPDGGALQPGNIIRSRAGKTVEIVNTDAEGRLILADALDLAQDEKPDALIDVATLTGAVGVALGKYCCAILGNSDELIHKIEEAGKTTAEKIWQLPLHDEYFEDLKADHADMKNSAADSNGGTIRGAAFLKQFIRKNTHWAHLDIAAMAYSLNHLSYCPKKGASGLYVRTLARLAADF